MAQAEQESISFILTEDAATLFKYCERLRQAGEMKARAIKLIDGFDTSTMRDGAQFGLDWDGEAH